MIFMLLIYLCKIQQSSRKIKPVNKSRPVGMADEVDSKSIDGNIVRVQVPRPALLGRGKTVEIISFLRFSFLPFLLFADGNLYLGNLLPVCPGADALH